MSLHNPILDKAREKEKAIKPVTATPTDTDIVSIAELETPAESSKLQAVQDALAASTTRIVSSIAQLEAGRQRTQVATQAITSAIDDITSARQVTARAISNADLQAQNATIEAFEVGGGTDMQVQLIAQLAEDNKRVDDILNERQALADEDRFGTGIGLLDTVINQFNINLTRQQLVAAEAQQEQTRRQIANLSAATESFARVNSLTKKTINEGTIEANYAAIEAEGAIKRSEAELKNINSNATALNNLMVADNRSFSNLLSIFRLEGEEQDRILKRERATFAREQMKFNREKFEVELPAAKVRLETAELALERSKKLSPVQQAQAEQNLLTTQTRFKDLVAIRDTAVENVQAGQSLAGIGIEDRETILFGLDRTGAARAKYDRLLELGSSPDPVLGQNPFEAKVSLGLVAPSGNVTPTRGINILDQINTLQAAKYKKARVSPPRDIETLESDFNQTAKELTTVFQADIKTGDASNPYHAPPMSVLEGMISVKNSSLYQLVLKPMQMKETNPQTIMDAAVSAIVAKTITPEQGATGINVIFDAAALYNNTLQGGFRRVGLPNQTTYNVQLKRPATLIEQLKIRGTNVLSFPSIAIADQVIRSLSGEEDVLISTPFTVDLMDRTRVQEAIIKILSASSAPESSIHLDKKGK